MAPPIDPPRVELTVAVGAERSLPVTSAGAVGYEWRIAAAGDTAAADARITSARPPDAPPGGSTALALTVRGVHPGAVTFHLTLGRGPAVPPRETLDVAVTVAP